MRDDLHRGAPVAVHWRTMIKRCASDAEWASQGARAFEHAVAKDANEQLSDRVIGHLQEAVAAGRVPLPGVSPDSWIGGSLSAVEQVATRMVMRELAQGSATAGTVERALTVALDQHLREVGRQVSGHVHSKDVKNHAEFIRRYRASSCGESVERAARLRAACQHVPVRQPSQRIGLDSHIGATP